MMSSSILGSVLSVYGCSTVGTWGYVSVLSFNRAYDCSGTQVICIGGH